jgi:hypothetical protein
MDQSDVVIVVLRIVLSQLQARLSFDAAQRPERASLARPRSSCGT